MLDALSPEEVMKDILFHFGTHTPKMLEHVAMTINSEKYHNPEAARGLRGMRRSGTGRLLRAGCSGR